MTEDLGGDPPCWNHLVHNDPDANDPDGNDSDGNGLIVVDLNAVDTTSGSGAIWSVPDGGDLNINLVHLDAAGVIEAHRNSEVDVALSVIAGAGRLTVDGTECPLRAGVFALVPKSTEREIRAGGDGITYLSMHRRRRPLGITPKRPVGDPMASVPASGVGSTDDE